jgi:hypothetical protein
MAKKTVRKTPSPVGSKPALAQPARAYPVEEEDLENQQQRLKRAAAAGAEAVKSAPPSPVTLPAPAKPLATLEKLWPNSTQVEAKPAQPVQTPVARVQRVPIATAAPKTTTLTAAPSPKPPTQSPPPPAAPPKVAVAAPPSKPQSPKVVDVNFSLVKPGAKRVSVCGDFNGWSPGAQPLKRNADGRWETTIALAPGHYQYKFVVDEEWIPDPAAKQNVPNQFGSLNSIVEVRV